MGHDNLIEMIGIFVSFPGVRALRNVNFTIRGGEVHALVGENGAGKTTLINVLGGIVKKQSGDILLNGEHIAIDSPSGAQTIGLSIIHQELPIIPELSVAQNIFLGKEIVSLRTGFLKSRQMNVTAQKVLENLGVNIDPKQSAGILTAGERQLVEIARVINSDSWLIAMDEPTSALTITEKERLFQIIRSLVKKGVAIIYVSHRMNEIFEIADRVTVLRDGICVGEKPINEITEDQIINLMVGKTLGDIFSREFSDVGSEVLKVKRLSKRGSFHNISFSLQRGEVLGFAGLMGSGRTELFRCIFGLDRFDRGEIYLDGRNVKVYNTKQAINMGIGFVPEDRKKEGIINIMNVMHNLSLPSLPWISKACYISGRDEAEIADKYINDLSIKVTSPYQIVSTLSGGNQQKISLGKWLARHPKILIMDEPTRGIDVSAKREIHKIVESIAKTGTGIILSSSELPELIGVCDRVIVLHKGTKIDELTRPEITIEKLILSQSGKGSETPKLIPD